MNWYKMLEDLPTLCQGQESDLKVDTGVLRVWLSRCGPADGTQYDHTVYVEFFTDGQWADIGAFDGTVYPHHTMLAANAYEATTTAWADRVIEGHDPSWEAR